MTRRLLLVVCCLCLLAGAAAGEVPCDRDGDGALTSAELATAILDSLDGRCMGGTVAAPSLVDLQDAAFVYTHWDGRALKITDSSGRTTTVTRPLRRIMIFSTDALRVFRSVGLEPDRLVGVGTGHSRDPVFYPEYQGKPDVGKSDYEQMALLRPDTVFFFATSSEISNAEIEMKLSSLDPDIRFFRFDFFRPPVYAGEVRALGLLLGKEAEADRYLTFYGNVTGAIAGVVDAIPAEDRVLVYLEANGNYVTGSAAGSGYHEKIELAGGRNIFADSPIKYPTVNPEEVVVRNPDVIVKLVSRGYGDADIKSSIFGETYQSIMNRPAWNQINAVRDGRVHIIDSSILGTCDSFIGSAYLAKWFYPDLFPDLDPQAIHQQYLSEFQRLDYDLDKHPAFVYPA